MDSFTSEISEIGNWYSSVYIYYIIWNYRRNYRYRYLNLGTTTNGIMNACTRPPPQTTETKTPTTAVVRRRTLETVESAHLDDEDDVEYLLEDDINESRDTEQEPDYDPNYSTRIKCHDSSGSSSKRTADETFGTSTFTGSVYGQPVSSSEATRLCPPPTADDVTSEGGFIYHAHLVSDEWAHPKDTDEDGTIKPRRPSLPVRQKDFFSSLVQTEDGRWLFSGVLNGWPGLTLLEVRSPMTSRRKILCNLLNVTFQ